MDYETYSKLHEENLRYYEAKAEDTQKKAFEYGLLVVKTGVLIAGGGLLALPTIISISSDLEIDSSFAAKTGGAFALALICSLLAAYFTHLNWNLHTSAWEKALFDKQKQLRLRYLGELEEIPIDPTSHNYKSITVTFYLPHICALFYLVSLCFGFLSLFKTFGVLS